MRRYLLIFVWLVIIGLLFLLLVFLGGMFTLVTDENTLKDGSLINYVEVDGVKLNMRRYGNTAGSKHKIVCISDYRDDDFSVTSELLFNDVLNDYEIIVIDRPGYGFSDDTNHEQTVDNVLSSYRSALSKLKIDGPYILLADGYGSVYATYWESLHDTEIEGIIYINPTVIPDQTTLYKNVDDYEVSSDELSFALINGLGFNRMFVSLEEIKPWAGLNEPYLKYSKALAYKNYKSMAKYSEKKNEYKNLMLVTKNMKNTVIPKLLISSVLNDSSEALQYFTYYNKLYEDSGSKKKYLLGTKDVDYQFAKYEKTYMDYKEEQLDPFMETLGNTSYVNIPGYERIYIQKPEEVRTSIKTFLNRFD